jgi:DNA-binding NarL/FixJ family response regulator
MKKTSIAIVEDNSDIRNALELIIAMSDEYNLVCSCINGEEALETIPDYSPEVVLMDINLGGVDGIECVRILKQSNPKTLFMMCTVLEEDEKIFHALSAGANGYMLKKTAPSKMLEAIKELCNGGAPMSSIIARKVVNIFQQKNNLGLGVNIEMIASLSTREKGVLDLLAKGFLYKEIGEELGLSAETVKKHLYHIYDKLHVRNRVEAINVYLKR